MRASDKYNGFYSPPHLSDIHRKRTTQSLSPTEDPDIIAADRESAIRRSEEWMHNVISSPLYDKKPVPRSSTFTKSQTSTQYILNRREPMNISIEDRHSSSSRELLQSVKKRPVYQENTLSARSFATDLAKRNMTLSEIIPEPPVEFQTDSIEDDLSLDFSTDDKFIKKDIMRTSSQAAGSRKVESSGSDLDRKTPQLVNGVTPNPKSAVTIPTPSISSHSLLLNNEAANGVRVESKGIKAESQLRMNKSFPRSVSPQSVIYDFTNPLNDGYATIVKGEMAQKTPKSDVTVGNHRTSVNSFSFNNYSKEESNTNNSDQSEHLLDKPPSNFKTTLEFLKRLFAFLFSHIGLSLLVIGYTILGALLFCHIEKDRELETKKTAALLREKTVNQYLEVLTNNYITFLALMTNKFSTSIARRPQTTTPTAHRIVDIKENKRILRAVDGELESKNVTMPPGVLFYIAGAGKPNEIVTAEEYKNWNLPISKEQYWDWSKLHAPKQVPTELLKGEQDFDFEVNTERYLVINSQNLTHLNGDRRLSKKFYVKASMVEVLPLIQTSLDELKIELEKIHNVSVRQFYKLITNEGWNGEEDEEKISWNIVGGILFAVTIITTIGYGHVTPKTGWGRFATMLYAVFGIPLFFSYLSSNGDYMARMFRLLYARGCRPAFRKICGASNPAGSRTVSEVLVPNKNSSVVQMLASSHSKRLNRNGPMDRLKNLFINPKARPRVDEESGLADGTGDSGNATDHVTTTSESSKPVGLKGTKVRQKLVTPVAPNGSLILPAGATTSQGGLEPASDSITVPISVTVSIMTIYIVIGASIFQIWERDLNFLHWSYFCFITLSTIGFGDIVPGTESDSKDKVQKLGVVTVYVALGLCLFAMCFKLMEEEAISKIRRIGERIGLIKRNIIGS